MGIVRKPSGVAPTWDPVALALPWPVMPSYAGWAGSTLRRSARNLAAPRLAAMGIVGAPTATTDGLLCDASNYLAGTIPETTDQTLIVAARSSQDQSGSATRMSLGGWGVGLGNGLSLYGGSATLLRYAAPYNVSGTPTQRTYSATMPAAFANTWGLYAVVQQAGVGLTFYDLTRGASQASAETSARILAASPALRIGSVAAGNAGQTQVAMAAVIPAALTAGQLATLRTAIAVRALALNGITL